MTPSRHLRGQVHLHTFREGLLSRLGHDLLLRVGEWSARLEGNSLELSVLPRSVQVVGCMRGGQVFENELSASDRRKIEGSIRDSVLRSESHHSILFSGRVHDLSASRVELKGELEIQGKRRPIDLRLPRDPDGVHADVEIAPSNWGISPFRALGGALKVKDLVRIAARMELPADLTAQSLQDRVHTWQA